MLEIEPFDALALTMHHTPGACALLLGSGLSRAAGIPTGWEITLDLVRKVAALRGVPEPTEPAAWYRETFGADPNYSVLLDAIASTPAERRAILHSYIEPGEDCEGRRPTAAHRAIARLVARGTVRVLVTTNFDRLLEQALVAAGIEPTVISGDDSLKGAIPLVHSRCTVLKVHGDYLDTRIRNIDAELSSYTPVIDAFLDQIIDTFGLVVCGWSGEWDVALRAALLRAPTRRYPAYWASYGEPAPLAQDLIDQRGARVIAIEGADAFFVKLSNTLDALAIANRPHPTAIQVLIAQAKRLCSDDAHGIAWTDWLFEEVEALRQKIDGARYLTLTPTNELGREFVAELVALSERLRRMFLICGRWGTTRARTESLDALKSLYRAPANLAGFTFWNAVRNVPAMLCFYWYGIGALASADYPALRALFKAKVTGKSDHTSLLEVLPPGNFDGHFDWKFLNTTTNWKLPASKYFADVLGDEILDVARSVTTGDALYDALETLIALEYAHLRLAHQAVDAQLWFWTPMGKFLWRHDGAAGLKSFDDLTADSEFLKAGLLGGSVESAAAAMVAVRELVKKANLDW